MRTRKRFSVFMQGGKTREARELSDGPLYLFLAWRAHGNEFLGSCGVNPERSIELGLCSTCFDSHSESLDDFARTFTNHVTAQNPVCPLVYD